MVSITQSTEVGTCYSVDEIAALADWAHAHDMWLHLDGARLANAAAFLGVDLGAFGQAAGVDVLSFGGTKNGAHGSRGGRLVPAGDRRPRCRYIRKQSMQLASKMRFVAAQFIALLTDDLWLRNATARQSHGPAARPTASPASRGRTGLSGRGQRGVRRACPRR